MGTIHKKPTGSFGRAQAQARRFKVWWHQRDRQYGWRWRAANLGVALLIVVGVASPILSAYLQNRHYQLSAATLGLVGQPDSALVSQLTYNAQTSTYEFNQSAVKSFDPTAALSSQVSSNRSSKSLYALDVPTDPSKGVTYHDINTQLNFTLTPQFKAMNAQTVQGHVVFPVRGGQAIYTLKSNGLKEDIVLQRASADTLTYSYHLNLPKTLEARVIPNSGGNIGIYSADPSLYGNISYGSAKDQGLVEKARENGAKTNLVFGLPAPALKTANSKSLGSASAHFDLHGNTLSVVVQHAASAKGPIDIDPSVVVTSTSDFQTSGNNEGNIDFSTSGQIGRAPLSTGAISWSTSAGTLTSAYNVTSVAYNGYLYIAQGRQSGAAVNVIRYALICTGSNNGVGGCSTTAGDVGTWNTGNSFTNNRVNMGLVAYSGYLYVIGGNSGPTDYGDAQYALICTGSNSGVGGCNGSAGSIGTWGTTTSMNSTRTGAVVAAYNGYMYAYGGCSSFGVSVCSAFTASVEYAPINADGTLGTWHYTHNSGDDGTTFVAGMNSIRYQFGGGAYNGYLYAVSGCNARSGTSSCSAITATTEYAPINTNGTVGAWISTTSQTAARDNFGYVVANGYIYTIGGCSSNGSGCNPDTTVAVAPINANGSIGAWTTTGVLPQAVYGSGSAYYNGYFYATEGCKATGTNCTGAIYGGVSYGALTNASGTQAYSGEGTTGAWHYTHSSTDDSTTFVSGFSNARYGQTSVAYNGYLYVLGGYDGSTYYNDVQYAPLNANGTVGTWSSTSSFTTARYGHASLVFNGYMYVIGGSNGSALTGVQYAPINTNGTLGAWHFTYNGADTGTTLSGGLITGLSFASASAYNRYIYVAGGQNTSGTSQAGVEYAFIGNDGTVGAWHYTHASTDDGTSFVSGFINARYSQASVAYNGYLYIIGGYDGSTYYNDVEYAPLNSNGTVGAWHYTHASTDDGTSFVSGFTTGRAFLAAFAYNNYLYIMGGTNGTYQGDTQYALINANGTIGSWTSTGSLNNARAYGSTTAYNGFLYLLGGKNASNLNDVQFTPLNVIARKGYYNKFIDLGSTYNVTSVSYTGNLSGGVGSFVYRAAGTSKVFSTPTAFASNAGAGGCYGSAQNTRYAEIGISIDDSYGGATGGSYTTLNFGQSVITDFTVFYYQPHPQPNIRLRGGQTLQTSQLSPLDNCVP